MIREPRELSAQEQFWRGNFGSEYIARNQSANLIASNLAFFAQALRGVVPVESCLELGANAGMNLRALQLLYPGQEQYAVEINPQAADLLREQIGKDHVFEGSISDFPVNRTYDLVLVKGVLIHINPDHLFSAYDVILQASRRHVLIAEYYSPKPTAVSYRGHEDRLFKRDFAGELLDRSNKLRLVDYGFVYHRDVAKPLDDISWFLLELVNPPEGEH